MSATEQALMVQVWGGADWQGGKKMSEQKTDYRKVTVSSCVGGWVVTQKGKPDQIYVRWEGVIIRLKEELTSYGDNNND